jgi:GTP-binding protein HflX
LSRSSKLQWSRTSSCYRTAKQELLGDVYDSVRVLSDDYDTTGRILKVRGLPGTIARLRRALAAS